MTGPQLLRLGWSRQRVEDTYLRLADEATAAGYAVYNATVAENAAAEALVAQWVMGDPHWRRPDDNGTIVAVDAAGSVVAALMLTAWAVEESRPTATLRALAVDPAHRRRGLGLVLMGALPRYVATQVGSVPGLTHGTCAPDAAPFYQRAGCTVLQAGERLPMLDVDLINVDERYPCHFTRDW